MLTVRMDAGSEAALVFLLNLAARGRQVSTRVVLRVVLNQRDPGELSRAIIAQPCAASLTRGPLDRLGAGRSEVQILSPR